MRRKNRFWFWLFLIAVLVGMIYYFVTYGIKPKGPCADEIDSNMNRVITKALFQSHYEVVETKEFNNPKEAKDFINGYIESYNYDTRIYGKENLESNGLMTVTIVKHVSDEPGNYQLYPVYAFVCVDGSL